MPLSTTNNVLLGISSNVQSNVAIIKITFI